MAITDPAAGHRKLDSQAFDDEIAAHGIDVLHRKGTRCPCANEESGQPDPGCDVCEGWGMIWDAGVTVRAFGPNRRIDRRYEEPGSIDLGDAYFTFKADTFVAHLDRLALPGEIMVVSEVFTKGDVNTLTGNTKEKSRFAKIGKIERAVWTQRNPASGYPYTTDVNELIAGTDFEVVNSREINWLNGSPPPDGARYTIRFQAEGEYLVWAPRARREGATTMPYQYLCKRLDFVRGANG